LDPIGLDHHFTGRIGSGRVYGFLTRQPRWAALALWAMRAGGAAGPGQATWGSRGGEAGWVGSGFRPIRLGKIENHFPFSIFL
jgi:hypothetical protein